MMHYTPPLHFPYSFFPTLSGVFPITTAGVQTYGRDENFVFFQPAEKPKLTSVPSSALRRLIAPRKQASDMIQQHSASCAAATPSNSTKLASFLKKPSRD